MSQKASNIVIADADGSAVLSDVNNVYEDIETWHAGASPPGTPVAHHKHHDTGTGFLNVRNAGNDAWVETVFNATTGLIGLAGMYAVVQSTQSLVELFEGGVSPSWTPLNSISASITPRDTNSRVLLILRMNAASEVYPSAFRLYRDSTAICIPPASGSRTRATGMIPLVGSDSNEDKANYPVSGLYVDSPATDSIVAYTVRVLALGGSGNYVYVNCGSDNTDEKETIITLSTLTAIEIAG